MKHVKTIWIAPWVYKMHNYWKLSLLLISAVILTVTGCVGNVRFEGSAEVADRVIKKLDMVSRGYENEQPDMILSVIDPSLELGDTIRRDIESNRHISLDISVGRFILEESGFSVYTVWNRNWTTADGTTETATGNTLLSFNPDTLLVNAVEGDSLFSGFSNPPAVE